MLYYKNLNLINYNSFHLNSIAKEIWFPEDEIELITLLCSITNYNILSYGTNVLLNNTINKIICLKSMPQEIKWYKNRCIVDANVLTNYFIQEVLNHNYSGLEGLLGIPGSVGAAIVGNAGSGSYIVSNFLSSVCTIDKIGKFHYYNKLQMNFKRRYSILQNKNEVLIWAAFEFNKKGINQEIINQTLEFRKNFPIGYSAGGIFKNWHTLKPYEKEIRTIQSPNLYVSSILNILINKGNATYGEILDFINKIKKITKEPLELEIKIIGKL